VAKAKRKLAAISRADVVGFSGLRLRTLGELELWRGARRVELPQSKKTRALFVYLAVGGRPRRRERLCSMFWDVADDPRAALRWSLSKLRALVDEPGVARIVTDGTTVGFEPAGAQVDLFAVRQQLEVAPQGLATDQLVQLADEFRGEFAEGLELPDFQEFQFWCAAMRGEARALHARVLQALLERLAARAAAAVPHARKLVQIDPLNVDACITLLDLLIRDGRRPEAEQQFEACRRLLTELQSPEVERLQQVWREVRRGAAAIASPASVAAVPAPSALPAVEASSPLDLIGRQKEWGRLQALLDDVGRQRRLRAVVIAGEPGIGKTRLLEELIATVRHQGGTALDGRAYEAEMGRPYGPWVDALRRVPAVSMGATIGSALAPLLPELGMSTDVPASRDRLFGAVVELIAARAHSAPPVLLVFDDAHWCDGASAELLHYVARMSRNRPVLAALAVRSGELPDNEPVLRVLRSLRRERQVEEIDVTPLSPEETERLVRIVAPDADAQRILEESAGNPLFALELARAALPGGEHVPATLRQLVRDRVDRLAPDAADVLRWGAVVGQTFPVQRLSKLTPIDIDRLLPALAILERHALLRTSAEGINAGTSYAFAHEVVRQVVYAELSAPRRRLMHLRIANALQEHEGEDDSVAADLAHHAALAGDTATAARACLQAGRRWLRLFAATEANAVAHRGMYLAGQLPEPERVKRLLELAEVRYAAHRPRRSAEAARTVEGLAQRALDQGCMEHARLGFHIASYIRWEGGDWSDAQRHMMRAEEVSRLGDERERVVALAEAARCLTLLERDLGHADALLLEADALSTRLAIEPAAIPDAVGMLRLHGGRLQDAAEQFARARDLCRRHQDGLGEFRALEHLVMVAFQRQQLDEAQALSDELVQLAGRLREGSEAPFAHAVAALCRYARTAGAAAELDAALAALRLTDAKQRLAYVQTRAAEADLQRGDAATARQRADEALQLARRLERPSDVVLARVVLAHAAALEHDEATYRRLCRELSAETVRAVSAQARAAAMQLRAKPVSGGRAHTTRLRQRGAKGEAWNR
jgi:DNA-binding SARP family transcriptional activator